MTASLISRLQALTGPDRELDADIWWAVARVAAERAYWNAAMGLPKKLPADWERPKAGLGSVAITNSAPRYTSSLDAALTLVQEGMRWEVSTFPASEDEDVPLALVSVPLDANVGWSDGATPAIALCIAALKARGVGHD